MDWPKIKRILEDVELAILENIFILKSYWKLSIFWLLSGGLVYILSFLLTGLFVQETSNISDYLYIIITGSMLSSPFWQAFGSAIRDARNLRYYGYLYAFRGFSYSFIFSFIWDLRVILERLLGYLIVVLIFSPGLLKLLLPIFISSLIIQLVSYGTGYIFLPLLFYFRSESSDIIHLIERIIGTIVPIGFMLSSFWFYKYLIAFPPIVFIEELRKLLLGKDINFFLLGISGIIACVYSIISYIVFKKSFDIARKKGWLSLQ